MTALRFERSHTILLGTAIALFLLVSFSKFDLLPSSSTVPSSSSPHAFDGSNPKVQAHKPGQPLTIDQRMARSEASWQRYKKQQKRALKMLPSVFEGWMSDHTKDHKMYVVWDFWNPAYTCPWDMERIGQLGDGGKWVCGLSKYIEFSEMHEEEGASPRPEAKGLSKKETKGKKEEEEVEEEEEEGNEEGEGVHGSNLVVYSFGVRDDSSFEEAMLSETNAEVVAVDFSVNSFGKELAPSHRDRSTFLKVGLGDADQPHHPDAPFYTLSTIMRKRGHSYIDYLKVDIEGAEWGSLGRFMDDCDAGVAGGRGRRGGTAIRGGGGKGAKKGQKMELKEAGSSVAGRNEKRGGLGLDEAEERGLGKKKKLDEDDYEDVDVDGEEVVTTQKRMPVGQLSMELHLNNDEEFGFQDLVDFIDRLEGFGMRCVFFEVNYWAARDNPPRYVEMVWVNVNDPRNVLWHE